MQSLRLLIVTPLILTKFNENEIAAWYLFASLNFFGTTITQRLGLTFSRMFAFAMAGKNDLSPIKERQRRKNEGEPNWAIFERAYGTIGYVNVAVAWVNILVAFGMGWFGLNNIVDGYEAKGLVWLAFVILQLSSLLTFVFQRYEVALQGMNYIALANRWAIVFSLLSILFGVVTLWFGGGLIALVLVMQLFTVLGVFRNKFLLNSVENGRVLQFKKYHLDSEVLKWAWEPTWKGFVAQFGIQGSIQITAVIYTAYANDIEIASFLFSLRVLQTIVQMSSSPFNSVQPLMARMLAAGDLVTLRSISIRRIALSLSLLGTGVGFGALGIPIMLDIIEAKIEFIAVEAWLLLGSLTVLIRLNVLCCAISAIGNSVVFHWEMAISAIISIIALIVLKNSWGIYTPIITSMVPLVIMLNVRPIRMATSVLRSA